MSMSPYLSGTAGKRPSIFDSHDVIEDPDENPGIPPGRDIGTHSGECSTFERAGKP